MPDALLNSLLPVGSVLLGFLAKFFTDVYQHNRSLEREREARAATRREALRLQRTNFQRQTLLDLQEAASDLVRSAGAMHIQDLKAYRETGKWQKQLFGEELNEKASAGLRRTTLLSVRVQDEGVRRLTEAMSTLVGDVQMCSGREASEIAIHCASKAFTSLNDRIGEILRSLDEEALASKEDT